MSLVTHLVIDKHSNVIHEFRSDLGILVLSGMAYMLDALRHVSELVFYSTESTKKNSVED